MNNDKQTIIKEIIEKHNLITFRHRDALNELYSIAYCRGMVAARESQLSNSQARTYRKHLDWYTSSLHDKALIDDESVSVRVEIN